jgi:hypothetical protein
VRRILKRKIWKRIIAPAILGMLALMLGSTAANAVTVYFNDADRGPSDVLQIGGITITDLGTGTPGQPNTVLGVGLGLDMGIGPVGEDYQQAHWSADQQSYDSFIGGDGLLLSVDGWINSVTILPVLKIYSGSGDLMPIPSDLNLEFSTSFLFGGSPIVPASGSAPVTLSALFESTPSTFYLTPQMNSDPSSWFSSYRQDHFAEEQTLQWGFTVLSVDYTPVPEPGVIAFLASGLVGLLCARRARRSYPPAIKG